MLCVRIYNTFTLSKGKLFFETFPSLELIRWNLDGDQLLKSGRESFLKFQTNLHIIIVLFAVSFRHLLDPSFW